MDLTPDRIRLNFTFTMLKSISHVARHIQDKLVMKMDQLEPKDRLIIELVKSWIEVERFKRECKGLPQLAPATIADVLAAQRSRGGIKRISSSPVIEMPEQSAILAETVKIKINRKKRDSENPETVTATPDPMKAMETE